MKHTDLEALLKQICDVLQVPVKDVKSTSRIPANCDVRKIFAKKAVEFNPTMSLGTIARVINRHRTSIYSMQDLYLDYIQYDITFREKAEKVRIALLDRKRQAA